MLKTHKVAMLKTGLIGMFYTITLHSQHSFIRPLVRECTTGRMKQCSEGWHGQVDNSPR